MHANPSVGTPIFSFSQLVSRWIVYRRRSGVPIAQRGERPSGEITTESATERRFTNRRLTPSSQGAYLHTHERRMTDSGRSTLTRSSKGPKPWIQPL